MKKIKRMRLDKIWFQDTDIQISCNIFNIDIVMFSTENNPMKFMDSIITPFD